MCFYTGDDEPVEMLNDRIVKTRKPHKCCSCGLEILAGQQCYNVGYFWNGKFYSQYVCNLCRQDQFAIVRHELHEGCDWYEAWCPIHEIREYMLSHDLPLATVECDLKAAWDSLAALNPRGGLCLSVPL